MDAAPRGFKDARGTRKRPAAAMPRAATVCGRAAWVASRSPGTYGYPLWLLPSGP